MLFLQIVSIKCTSNVFSLDTKNIFLGHVQFLSGYKTSKTPQLNLKKLLIISRNTYFNISRLNKSLIH